MRPTLRLAKLPHEWWRPSNTAIDCTSLIRGIWLSRELSLVPWNRDWISRLANARMSRSLRLAMRHDLRTWTWQSPAELSLLSTAVVRDASTGKTPDWARKSTHGRGTAVQ